VPTGPLQAFTGVPLTVSGVSISSSSTVLTIQVQARNGTLALSATPAGVTVSGQSTTG